MGRVRPGTGEHNCWSRPPAEEQPDGETCVQGTWLFKSHVKTWHLGSQHGKHNTNRDSEVGIQASERQVEVRRRSVHRRLLEGAGAEISRKWQRPSRLSQRLWTSTCPSLCFLLFKVVVFLSIAKCCYKVYMKLIYMRTLVLEKMWPSPSLFPPHTHFPYLFCTILFHLLGVSSIQSYTKMCH